MALVIHELPEHMALVPVLGGLKLQPCGKFVITRMKKTVNLLI
jgi:hypothetical protein